MKQASGHSSNEEIDHHIQKNAPYISSADFFEAIDFEGIQYYRFPETRVTICCISLKNGFSVIGQSAVLNMENYDEDIAKKIALKDAKDRLWPLLGFALCDRIARANNEPMGLQQTDSDSASVDQ